MYVGRIVAAGRTRNGYNAVAYRVSSRSFPNRMAVDREGTMVIVPRPGFESDLPRSPYISYNALRLAGEWAVATNGSHTDPIVEKMNAGVPVRDAMALTLLAMDYEHDDFDTPRIAAAVPLRGDTGWMAIVRRDGLVVREVPLEDGVARYVATYEVNDVRDDRSSAFDASTAAEAALFTVTGGAFAGFEKPVTSVAALANDGGFALGAHVVE